jgi:ankyrin repeat protein
MKRILITTIVAVLVVGCGKPSNPAADRALLKAAEFGNIEAVKQHLAAGADVNANNRFDSTPLDWAITSKQTEIADLLRKHGGKTKKELEAEGK